jgi:hypothetical protein
MGSKLSICVIAFFVSLGPGHNDPKTLRRFMTLRRKDVFIKINLQIILVTSL